MLPTIFPGLDNAFVVLNSWHRSDRKASVEDRLGDTMAEAGVSCHRLYEVKSISEALITFLTKTINIT